MKPQPSAVSVAMSGGVDSSVAAALLQRQGHRVSGVALRLPTYGAGPQSDGPADAARVAEALGIPLSELDCRRQFEHAVVSPFWRAYRDGRTPNPCVMCNRRIKFGLLLDEAVARGAELLATGHYVQKTTDPATGRIVLAAADGAEDQSYFLYALSQEQLRHALFPLASLTKAEVRDIARELELPVHDKPDSQDICFLPGGQYRELLRLKCPEALRPGPIVHVSGEVMGEHEGLASYTIGQRRGLGIAHREPLYVVGFRREENALIVGERQHILREEMLVGEANWVSIEPPHGPLSAEVKIRYNHRAAEAELTPLEDGQLRVRFAAAQEAPCPGQSAVFYRGRTLLGGGTIQDSAGGE